MDFVKYAFLIPLLPLLGALFNGVLSFSGGRIRKRLTGFVACGAVFASFVIAAGIFWQLLNLPADARSMTVNYFSWFDLPLLKANIAFLIDPLSVVMALVVTGVGFLIHVYSIGYMSPDVSFTRFFSYLNLFCFAMLTLVLADNLLLMFVGWEGVGLCSYLLIGFWFEHKPNAVAGMKAFLVNRIGDFGFLIGLMLLFWTCYSVGQPSVTFNELREIAPLLADAKIGSFAAVTVICLFLFFGATGKSAQLPLYVWLPDAMAGPTPVSALIHAATMVTAGVYMIGRLNFLFSMSPVALMVVATVGGITALFAASIGFAQNDIKKVLAYSTVSQLGFMFLGMGTGMYAAGIFHLVTHAFFKACLFLGAGAVILGMHHEQDIQKMGGLRKYMPVTFWTFLIATLALSGIFPLAGFFSKDEILWQVFSRGGEHHLYYILWAFGILGAICTAFYMFRLVSLTFFGELRTKCEHDLDEADALDDQHHDVNLHQPMAPQEQPKVITSVLVVLALLSAVAGFVGVPHALGKFIHLPNFFDTWLMPVFESAPQVGEAVSVAGEVAAEAEGAAAHAVNHASAFVEYLLMGVSLLVAFGGIFAAVWLYLRRLDLVESFTARFALLYKIVQNKYYVDEIYDAVFVKPVLALENFLKRFDEIVIDGLVNAVGVVSVFWAALSGWVDSVFVDGSVKGVANLTIAAGRRVRKIQTGRIQHYYYLAMFGLIVLIVWRLFA